MGNELMRLDETMELISIDPRVGELMGAVTRAKMVTVLTIRDEEGKKAASHLLLDAQDVLRKGEELSKELRDPFFQMSKRIKGFFDDAVAPVKGKVREIKDRLNDYTVVQRKKAADDQAKAQAKLDKIKEKNPEIADQLPETAVAPVAQTTTRTEKGTTFIKKTLLITSVNIRELAMAVGTGAVPEGVFEIKEGFIKTLIKGGMVLPGVESKYVEDIQARR
jgi:hypothetical protein